MAAYQEIEGIPCHVNPWLLTDVLRGKLGFEGIVVGDYQGIDLVRQYQKIGTSDANAARMPAHVTPAVTEGNLTLGSSWMFAGPFPSAKNRQPTFSSSLLILMRAEASFMGG